MTPPAHPVELRVRGPVDGYTVTVHGATVFSDISGTVATMPAAMDSPAGIGVTSFYIDHAPGDPVQLHVVVTATDGTVLLDRTVASLPAYVDALDRDVLLGNPESGAFE